MSNPRAPFLDQSKRLTRGKVFYSILLGLLLFWGLAILAVYYLVGYSHIEIIILLVLSLCFVGAALIGGLNYWFSHLNEEEEPLENTAKQ